jgi:hypothetical protein
VHGLALEDGTPGGGTSGDRIRKDALPKQVEFVGVSVEHGSESDKPVVVQ